MGNSLCSPQTPGATPEGSVKEVLGVLKKAARPSSRWQDLAPSVGQWYQELDAILRALQENGFGSNGADMDKVKRTTMVCIGTVKGVYYWVKEINANFGQGTDGPMIGRAAAVRLERALKPHLAILQAHRDDCLQKPSTFFTYALMSLRPALKDHMRWVDQKFKEWDEQVLDEMERSKQDFQRAGSTGEPAWQSQVAYERRPIALYCDGQHIGAIDPGVYASKLGQRH